MCWCACAQPNPQQHSRMLGTCGTAWVICGTVAVESMQRELATVPSRFEACMCTFREAFSCVGWHVAHAANPRGVLPTVLYGSCGQQTWGGSCLFFWHEHEYRTCLRMRVHALLVHAPCNASLRPSCVDGLYSTQLAALGCSSFHVRGVFEALLQCNVLELALFSSAGSMQHLAQSMLTASAVLVMHHQPLKRSCNATCWKLLCSPVPIPYWKLLCSPVPVPYSIWHRA